MRATLKVIVINKHALVLHSIQFFCDQHIGAMSRLLLEVQVGY